MYALFEIAIANSIIATLLALAVLLLTRVVRHPAIVQLLWVLVLAKLVTPPLVVLPWSTSTGNSRAATSQLPTPGVVAPLVEHSMSTPDHVTTLQSPHAQNPPETVPAPAVSTSTSLPTTEIAEVVDDPLSTQLASRETTSLDAFAEADAETTRSLLRPAPFSDTAWTSLVIAMWLVGSVVYALIAAARLTRFQCALRHARLAGAELREIADSVATSLNYRRNIKLLITSARLTPLVWPIGRPTLVLSQPLIDELSRDELQTLLAHELAHLRRRDHWVRWLELTATTLYWWHPVVWYARRAIQHAEERACDAWVVGAFPASARDYASALLKTVDFVSGPRADAPILASALTPGADLKERIEHVMNATWKPTISMRMRFALLFAAIAVLSFSISAIADDKTSTKAQQPPVATNQETNVADLENEQKEDRSIEPGESLVVEIVGMAREGESWDLLRGNVIVREDGSIGLGPMAGRVKVAGKTLKQAEEVIKPHVEAIQQRTCDVRVSFDVPEGAPSLSFEANPVPPSYASDPRYNEAIARSLAKPVNLAFEESPLYAVIDDLALSSGIDIILDPTTLDEAGINGDKLVTINLKNKVSLKSALNLILEPLGLTFVIEDEVLKITTEARAENSGQATARSTKLELIQPGDTVHVWVANTLAEEPINDDFVVEPGGTVALGPIFGRVKIAGYSFENAEGAIADLLATAGFKEPKVQVTLPTPATRPPQATALGRLSDLNQRESTILPRIDSIGILKVIAERAKSDYERSLKLADDGVIRGSTLAQKKADYDVSLERIRQAEQVLRQRQLELQIAELELNEAVEANKKLPGVFSPFELKKRELTVEFAKAKVAEIAEKLSGNVKPVFTEVN